MTKIMHEILPQNNFDSGYSAELGTIITLTTFILSYIMTDISEGLRIIALIISILAGIGTMLINRKKYKEEFLKLTIIKWIKNAFKKTK